MSTIKDVAKMAGVSISTVSRVVNNKGYISEQLRASVQAAMEALDYHPNEMARALHRTHMNIIGLVVPHVDKIFFAHLVQAIETKCTENDYKLILCTSEGEYEREESIFHMLRSNKVAGVIVAGHVDDTPDFANLPIIAVDREISQGVPMVVCDNEEGGRIAARTFAESGCKNVAMLTGADMTPPVKKRHEGFMDECAKLGIPARRVQMPDWFEMNRKSFECFSRLFEELPDVDGYFGVDDLAVMCRSACDRLGIALPGEKCIIGYDGFAYSERFDVTTIEQPVEEMGELAFDLLLKRIEGRVVPSQSVLPVTLIRRGTTR